MTFSFSRLLAILFISVTIIACSENTNSNTSNTETIENTENVANIETPVNSVDEESAKEAVESEAAENNVAEVPTELQTLPNPEEELEGSTALSLSENTAETQPEAAVETVATTTAEQTTQTTHNFVAGTHYDVIDPPIEVTSDNVQVAELFWYGCGHCFQLEPYMVQWKKSKADYIDFLEVPAIFGPQWKFHAQAFYTTKALGIKEDSHQKIFDSIHINKKRVSNLSQLQELLETFGQSSEKTEAAFNSFAVDSNMRSAQLFGQKSGARAVPTIIVDGKYRTSVSDAGGHDKLIQLINHLAKKANDERKG